MASAKSNPPPLSPHATILLPPPAFVSSNMPALTFLAPTIPLSSGIFKVRSPASVLSRQSVSSRPSTGAKNPRRTCTCAPMTHPGSFRCSLHRSEAATGGNNDKDVKSVKSVRSLDLRRLAMRNSMARSMGETVGGEIPVKRPIIAMISLPSRIIHRRDNVQPSRSRLSIMSKADD